MSGRYLLDTNVIIALFTDETAIKANLASAEEVFLPCIAIAELSYGARKSGKPRENLQRIDELAVAGVVLGCDTETALRYGDVKDKLRLKGVQYRRTTFGLRRLRFNITWCWLQEMSTFKK